MTSISSKSMVPGHLLVVEVPQKKQVLGPFLGDEGDGAAVGCPVDRALAEGQVVENCRAHSRGDALDHGAVAQPDDVDVLFDAVGGEHREHVAAERPARCRVERVDVVVLHDPGGEFRDVVAVLQQRPVLLAHVRLPAFVEGLHVDVEQPLQELVGVGPAVPDAENAADLFRAVVRRDVLHQAVALLVGEERIWQVVPGGVHHLEGNQLVGGGWRRAAPSRRWCPFRPPLRRTAPPLHDPGGRAGDRVGDPFDRPAVDDVVLEDVHQLVHEDVAKVVEVAVEGDDHAVAPAARRSRPPRRQEGLDDVGLLELVVGLEDDDRRFRRTARGASGR